jgi:hypothetical protein
VPLAVPVAVSTSTAPAASAAALSSATTSAATPALFRPIATLAVNWTVFAGLKGHCGRLTTTGANHGGAGAHAAAPAAKTAIVLGMGRSMAASAPGRALLGLAARFAASRRRVAAFLKKLLLSGGEDKFLTAVATRK